VTEHIVAHLRNRLERIAALASGEEPRAKDKILALCVEALNLGDLEDGGKRTRRRATKRRVTNPQPRPIPRPESCSAQCKTLEHAPSVRGDPLGRYGEVHAHANYFSPMPRPRRSRASSPDDYGTGAAG
jgi:hypothetical protein